MWKIATGVRCVAAATPAGSVRESGLPRALGLQSLHCRYQPKSPHAQFPQSRPPIPAPHNPNPPPLFAFCAPESGLLYSVRICTKKNGFIWSSEIALNLRCMSESQSEDEILIKLLRNPSIPPESFEPGFLNRATVTIHPYIEDRASSTARMESNFARLPAIGK